ncbi:MAG TPA: hypothetical protein VER03_23525 [Bryobacteraceae bacterium]|nr:hypothetical protein [Bryobacteraceae bacterium]
MAKMVQTTGLFTMGNGREGTGRVTEYSVGAASGTLGSVIHGLRVELRFLREDGTDVVATMGAADALQLSEEIRTAVHRREDVRR